MTVDQVASAMELIAEPGTFGTREEWLYHFERTKATNEPGMLFADAIGHQLLVEGEPGLLVFVGRSDYE